MKKTKMNLMKTVAALLALFTVMGTLGGCSESELASYAAEKPPEAKGAVDGLTLTPGDGEDGLPMLTACWDAQEGADGYAVMFCKDGTLPAAPVKEEPAYPGTDYAAMSKQELKAALSGYGITPGMFDKQEDMARVLAVADTAAAEVAAADAYQAALNDYYTGADLLDAQADAQELTGLGWGEEWNVVVGAYYLNGDVKLFTEPAFTAAAAEALPVIESPALTAVGVSQTEIKLTWETAPGATGYVLRCGAAADEVNDVLYEAGADETEYVNGPLAAGTTVYYTIAAKYKTHEYAPKGAGGSSDEAVASGGSAKGVGATTTKPAPAYSGGGSGSGSGSGGSGDYITTESSYWVKCNDGTVFNFTEYNEMIVFMSSAECAAHGGFIGNGSWGGGSSTYGHISSGVTDEMLMDLSREAENRAKQEMEGSMPWNW